MDVAHQRMLALWAARGCLREMGMNPAETTAEEAHVVLDELARCSPDLVACQWYREADAEQLALFYAEWWQWVADYRDVFAAQ